MEKARNKKRESEQSADNQQLLLAYRRLQVALVVVFLAFCFSLAMVLGAVVVITQSLILFHTVRFGSYWDLVTIAVFAIALLPSYILTKRIWRRLKEYQVEIKVRPATSARSRKKLE